jgi:hypothetical protein
MQRMPLSMRNAVNPLTEETSEYGVQILSTHAWMQQRASSTSQHQRSSKALRKLQVQQHYVRGKRRSTTHDASAEAPRTMQAPHHARGKRRSTTYDASAAALRTRQAQKHYVRCKCSSTTYESSAEAPRTMQAQKRHARCKRRTTHKQAQEHHA